MSRHTSEHEPISHDESTWTIDWLEFHAATLQGRRLEAVRWIAQFHAYQADEPRGVRLRWAALSLDANRRGRCYGPWDQNRVLHQEFALRMWIIEHLGPDPDPAWSPDALADDTLTALTLDPADAEALAANWRSLPVEQIGELRRHKHLTAHLDGLVRHLQPGPTREQLIAWLNVRPCLP